MRAAACGDNHAVPRRCWSLLFQASKSVMLPSCSSCTSGPRSSPARTLKTQCGGRADHQVSQLASGDYQAGAHDPQFDQRQGALLVSTAATAAGGLDRGHCPNTSGARHSSSLVEEANRSERHLQRGTSKAVVLEGRHSFSTEGGDHEWDSQQHTGFLAIAPPTERLPSGSQRSCRRAVRAAGGAGLKWAPEGSARLPATGKVAKAPYGILPEGDPG